MAVQNFVHARQHGTLGGGICRAGVQQGVPGGELIGQLRQHLIELVLEGSARFFQLVPLFVQFARVAPRTLGRTQFFQVFVQLEDFFQQIGGRLLFDFAFLAHLFQSQQVLGAGHGIVQGSVGVVQSRGALQAQVPLVDAGVVELVGVQLPAQLMELFLELPRIQSQLARQAEKAEVVGLRHQRLNFTALRTEVNAAFLRVCQRRAAFPALQRAGDTGGLFFRRYPIYHSRLLNFPPNTKWRLASAAP